MIILYRVEAPNFTAGFCTDQDNRVWLCAPILRRPLLGLRIDQAVAYCKTKHWKVQEVRREL